MIGTATKIPDKINGIKAPLKSTLCARRGIQPIGEVLRIINDREIKAVRMIVFKEKFCCWSIKK
jgi:hypothetical protein